MKFENVVLESIAYELPDEVWSSDAIEEKLSPMYERLKLPQGRLELMTGIRERRFWPKTMRASEASSLAGKKVLEKSRFKGEEIDLLIHSSVCRDRLEPATAAYVHKLLGLGAKTQVFDISNACLGFLNAMVMAGGMIESGQIRTALIVSGENGRALLENTIEQLLRSDITRKEVKPFFANLTIGGGAVGAVLTHRSLVDGEGPRLLGGCVETDTSASELCEGDSPTMDSLEMQTDSEKLLEAGIGVAQRGWKDFEAEMGWSKETPDRIICHQVGRRHLVQLYDALGLDLEKDYSTFSTLGNMGSASLPITLAKAAEEGSVTKGSLVALLGIGSGLSGMFLGMEW